MFEPQLEKSIEKYLVETYFPSRILYVDDMKELGIPEIVDFVKLNNIPIPLEGTRHFRKENLLNALKERLSMEEFDKLYRPYRAKFLIKQAKKVKITFENIQFEPDLKCRAFLEYPDRKQIFTITIMVMNGKIAHSDCEWVNNHQVFCFHLFALFMELAKRNQEKTMEFLQLYKT